MLLDHQNQHIALRRMDDMVMKKISKPPQQNYYANALPPTKWQANVQCGCCQRAPSAVRCGSAHACLAEGQWCEGVEHASGCAAGGTGEHMMEIPAERAMKALQCQQAMPVPALLQQKKL